MGQAGSGRDPGVRRLSPYATRLLKILAFAFIIEYFVLPQLADAREALDVVQGVNPMLLVGAVVLQVAAYGAHVELVRSLLPKEQRPSRWVLVRIELAGRAASHTIPAGTAAGAALSFRLLQRSGVRGADAGFASAAQAIGSTLVLHALTWGALAVSIPLRGFQDYYGVAALLAVLLVGGATTLVLLARGGEGRAVRVARRAADRLPLLNPRQAGDVVARLVERVRWLTQDRSVLGRSASWSAVHWLCDAGSLWLVLGAFGHHIPVDVLLVVFGISSMFAALPVTPRGLGVVEASLITLLASFGVPRAEAVLGVVTYRLVSFWLPIPLGAAAYVSLEVELGRRQPLHGAIGDVLDKVGDDISSFQQWVGSNVRRQGS